MKSHVSTIRIGLFLLMGSILLSCQKSALKDIAAPASSKSINQKMAPAVSHKNGVITIEDWEIRGTDIETTPTYFTRQIDVYSLRSQEIVNTFMLTVQTEDRGQDMYQSLLDNNFTGVFTISSDGFIFLTKRAVLGQDFPMQYDGWNLKMARRGIQYNFSTVAYTVVPAINTGAWTEYASYLIERPEDYLLPWSKGKWGEKQ